MVKVKGSGPTSKFSVLKNSLVLLLIKFIKKTNRKKKILTNKFGHGGVRTHASREIGA